MKIFNRVNKKLFVTVFLAGVLVLAGTGCGGKSPTNVPKQTNASSTVDSEASVRPETTNESSKLGEKITTGECAELKAIALYASYLLTAKNDAGDSAVWSRKLYDKMDAYGKKYGVTRDGIAETCRAKISEPGFDKAVEKKAQELGITIK